MRRPRFVTRRGAALVAASFAALAGAIHCGGSSPAPAPTVQPYPALAAGFSAGFAEEKLPFPVGIGLAGYGGRYEGFVGTISGGAPKPPEGDRRPRPYSFLIPPSIGVHTPPWVRSVALTRTDADGEDTVVLARIDMIVSPNTLTEEAVRLVKRKSGVDLAGRLFITASHTHASGGRFWDNLIFQSFGGLDSFNPEIFTRITRAIADSVDRALRDREPARIGVGFEEDFDHADLVFHDRRFENDGDDLVDNADPTRADPSTGELVPDGMPDGRIKDRRLTVMRVERADGTPKLALVHFGIHGTALTQRNLFLSTDAIGMIETKSRERLGVPVVHLQGATGDVQPAEVNLGFQGMERIGEAAAPVIARVFDSIQATGEPARIRSASVTFRQDRQLVGYDTPAKPYPDFDAPFGAIGCGLISDLTNFLPIPQIPGVLTPFQCISRPATFDVQFLRSTLSKLLFGVLTDDFGPDAMIDDLLEDIVVGVNPEGGPYLEPGFLFFSKASVLMLSDVPVTTSGGASTRDLVILPSPGEPTTPWTFETRRKLSLALPGIAFADTFILGYAADHAGYIVNPEDWVLGGSREIQINPWGPLWGEYARERELDVARALGSGASIDPGPAIPAADPVPYFPPQPTSSPSIRIVAQPSDTARFGTVHVRFVAGDPIVDTPNVVVERRTEDGSFVPVALPGGRALDESGYETILVYDYDETDPANRHLWSLHWQITEHDALGTFRFHVRGVNYDGAPVAPDVPYWSGVPYELASEPFRVQASTAIAIQDVVLTRDRIAVRTSYPEVPEHPNPNVADGFRNLPARPSSAAFRADIVASGGNVRVAEGMLDLDGNAALPSPLPAGRYDVNLRIEDEFGNTGAEVFRSLEVGS